MSASLPIRTTHEAVKANTTTQASEKANSSVRLGKYALNIRITISTVLCCWPAPASSCLVISAIVHTRDAWGKRRQSRLNVRLLHLHGLSVAIRFSVSVVVVLGIFRQSANPVQHYSN